MGRRRSPLAFAAALALALTLGLVQAARGDLVITTEAVFLGIRHTHATGTWQGSRALTYDLVDVDLRAPGIHFQVSPGSPGRPGYAPLETTRQYVGSVGAQVGINANPFTPGIPAQVLGQAASNGSLFAPSFFGTTVNIASNNAVSFFDSPPAGGTNLFNAVAGYGHVVTNGLDTAFGATDLAARTAIGLTATDHLLLLTVDGHNPGHSDGVTYDELAQILLQYHAYNAVNLDGGGSTTMVFANPTPTVINVPGGDSTPPGFERPVAVNLAVFAQPVPEPSAAILLCLGAGLALARLRVGRPAGAPGD